MTRNIFLNVHAFLKSIIKGKIKNNHSQVQEKYSFLNWRFGKDYMSEQGRIYPLRARVRGDDEDGHLGRDS